MKRGFYIVLLLSFTMGISSCGWLFGHNEDEQIFYNLSLHFQDDSGHDLVKDIAGTDAWVLNIVLANGIVHPAPGDENYKAFRSDFFVTEHNVGYCLSNYNSDFKDEAPAQKTIVYHLQCPHIFGDSEWHQIYSYWNVSGDDCAVCYSIEFEGKEIIPELQEDKRYCLGIITLDK
jgi:hypothetical protein